MRFRDDYIVRTITITCFVWTVTFLLLYGSQRGRDWYSYLASRLIRDDHKGGVPVVMLGIPILFAGTICSISTYRAPYSSTVPQWRKRGNMIFKGFLSLFAQHRVIGDGNYRFDLYALLFILVPCNIFVVSSIWRHLHHLHVDSMEATKVAGNSFGMMAVIAMSFFLLPVARHAPISKVLGWSPVGAVRLHIWSGRMIVIGSIAHGCMHLLRWKMLGEHLQSMVIPPHPCWTLSFSNGDHHNVEQLCSNALTECSCYDYFRNFTGFIGGVAMVLIGLTSLSVVRRRCYSLFYACHILAAPIILVSIILHYNRAILYSAPSLLYYLGSSIPAMVESRFKSTSKGSEGVVVHSIERIPGPPIQKNGIRQSHQAQKSCISITFQASDLAMESYQSGLFVKLFVPELSNVAHPFTINKVPGQHNQVRIIFQEVGNFTNQLATRLCERTASMPPPQMYLDGYHGSPDRVSQVLNHDVAIMVAGGIGITPYLSLLPDVLAARSERVRSASKTVGSPKLFATKSIVLHWVCRNPNLVDYVCKEYFQPLVDSTASQMPGCQIRIHIYQTSQNACITSSSYTLLPLTPIGTEIIWGSSTVVTSVVAHGNVDPDCNQEMIRIPFTPSRFSIGYRSRHDAERLCANLTFPIIAWLGLVLCWFFYAYIQQEAQVWQRVLAPFVILLLAIGVSFASQNVSSKLHKLKVPTIIHCSNLDEGAFKHWWSTFCVTEDEKASKQIGRDAIRLFPRGESSVSAETWTSFSSSSSSCEEVHSGMGHDVGVTIDEARGRPTSYELLRTIDNRASSPGVFCCGPAGLIQMVRNACEEKSLMRMQQDIPGDYCIPVFDEAFLL